MVKIQDQEIEYIKQRKLGDVEEILTRTRKIRAKITAASGKWDAAAIIRGIRYAKK